MLAWGERIRSEHKKYVNEFAAFSKNAITRRPRSELERERDFNWLKSAGSELNERDGQPEWKLIYETSTSTCFFLIHFILLYSLEVSIN